MVNQLKLADKAGPVDLSMWEDAVDATLHPLDEVTIAVVGKYVDHQDAYKSVGEALKHGGLRQRTKVNLKWLEAQDRKAPTWLHWPMSTASWCRVASVTVVSKARC